MFKNCVNAVAANPVPNPAIPVESTTSTTGAVFQINSTQLYVPVVTVNRKARI